MLRRWTSLALSVLMTSSGPLLAQAGTDWYTLKAGGRTIGQVSIRSYPQTQGKEPGTVTEISNTGHYQREGDPFDLNATSRFVESPDGGKPLSFSYEYQLGPEKMLQAEGQLTGSDLDVRLVKNDTVLAGKAPVSSGEFLFPGGPGIEKVYQTHYHDQPGSRFHFQTLHLGVQPSIVNTEVTLLETEKLALAGENHELRKFEVKNPTQSNTQSKDGRIIEWRDAHGKLYKAHSIGDDMEMVYASQRQVREAGNATLDLITSAQVVTNAIPQPRMTTEALYRIAPLTGQSINWDTAIPESFNQQVIESGISGGLQRITPDELYLKVLQKEPPDVSATFPAHFDSPYLEGSPYMQAQDPAMIRTAKDIVGKEKRSYFAARMLQQWVYQNIAAKDLRLGFAGASETLLSREGDCTEHAVLLAALNRALGIPARVAVGLIYLPDNSRTLGRFVYHMWTEVYLGNGDQGTWIPLDATIPQPLMDATHIKLADSALNDTDDLMQLTQQVVGLMGKIKIDVLKAISPSQSILSIGKQSGALSAEITKNDAVQEFDLKTMSRDSIRSFRTDLPPKTLSLETVDGLFTYGVEQLSKSNYGEAVQAFHQAMNKLRRPIQFYRLGEQLAGIEMYALSAKAFQEAASQDPTLAPYASAWLNAYLPARPLSEDQNAIFMQAISLQLDHGDAAGAANLLRAVTQANPSFAPAYWHLGQVTQGADSIQALNRALGFAPGNFRYVEALGDSLVAQKKYTQAAKAYQQAASVLSQQRFSQARPWLDAINGKRLISEGKAQLAMNSHSAAGWLASAQGLLLQHRLNEATTAFQNAYASAPGSADAQIGRFEAALENFDWPALDRLKGKIGALSVGHAKAARLLGQYQMHTRQYRAAIQSLNRAIAMAPQQPESFELLSQVYLRLAEVQESGKHSKATVAMAKAERQQAENILKRGIALNGNSWNKQALMLQLAQLLLDETKPQPAQSLAEQALQLNPLNADAYRLKGAAQFYNNALDSARETLEITDLLSPQDSRTLTLLGHVAIEEGKESLGLDYYEKATKADPLNIEAATALRKVMGERQMAGTLPPSYVRLSDDEHDFLVQLLQQVRRSNLNHVGYLHGMNEAFSGEVPFSVSGIQAIQGLVTSLNKAYSTESSTYRTLAAMKAPPRLARLHYESLRVSRQYMDNYQQTLQDSAEFLSSGGQGTILQHFQRSQSQLGTAEAAFASALETLTSQLPPTLFQGIADEAQLSNLASLRDESNRLSGQLSAALSRKQDKAASGAGTPSVTDFKKAIQGMGLNPMQPTADMPTGSH